MCCIAMKPEGCLCCVSVLLWQALRTRQKFVRKFCQGTFFKVRSIVFPLVSKHSISTISNESVSIIASFLHTWLVIPLRLSPPAGGSIRYRSRFSWGRTITVFFECNCRDHIELKNLLMFQLYVNNRQTQITMVSN